MRILLILFLLFSFTFTKGQSLHYWSNKFNTESSLLGDAVVAGNSGIAAIYFNPSHIPESDFNQFSLSANLVNLKYAKYKNGLGQGIDISEWGFRVQPRFISMIIHSKRNKNISYQFALFNKSSNDIYIYNDYFDNSSDGYLIKGNEEEYQGIFDYNSSYSDYRPGFGIGFKLNKHWKAGAALFGVVKNYYSRRSVNISVNGYQADSTEYGATGYTEDKLNGYDVRISGSVGISYRGEIMAYGLTIHLPSVKLWGNTDVLKVIQQSKYNLPDTLLPSFNYDESGKYRYNNFKDPLSIAGGLIYFSPGNKVKYYLSAEYFFPVKRYKIIDGTKVVSSQKDNSDKSFQPGSALLDYWFSAKGVINIALGFEYDLWEKVDLMAGFKTDFEAASEQSTGETYNDLTMFHEVPFNFYHINFGAKFSIKKSSIIAGAQYNTGRRNDYLQYANFKDIMAYDETANRILQGPVQHQMDFSIHDLGFYFGILFGF